MIADSTMKLIPAALDLVDEVRSALIESYPLHSQFLLWPKPEPTQQEVFSNMALAVNNIQHNQNELRYFIKRNSDGKLLGCIGLIVRDLEVPFYELGYWVRESEQGKGYVTTAVRLLEQHAVKNFSARRMEIQVAETNTASRRVAQKAGYTLEAIIQCNRHLPGGRLDNTCIYSKLFGPAVG